MTIKNKLRLGIGFLFLTALISSGLADYYLRQLSNDSKLVLKDNYRSLIYVKNIGQLLDATGNTLPNDTQLKIIQTNIDRERQNITEKGESKLTDSLQYGMLALERLGGDPLAIATAKAHLKAVLYGIMQLNMTAMERKNAVAGHTANRAIVIVSLITTLCLLAGFSFTVNFPGYIANPVTKNITQLQRISDAKTTFISTVSHELKTPISSIKLSLKLLEDKRVGALNNEQGQLLQSINADTQRLLQITSELLNATQIEAGKIQLNFSSTKPVSIAEYSVKAIQFLAEQKPVMIHVNCPETLPEVMTDPDKTAWVLINLLSNAVKYSPQNSVIELKAAKKGNLIEFSVKDQGPGIESQYLANLFERYFKVPGNTESGGTGLGLAIARDFIEAQGGDIGVESEPGQGSRFYFNLLINYA